MSLVGIEVKDMPSATQVNNADYFMIVQNDVNKKADKEMVLTGIPTIAQTGNKINLEINSSTYTMVAKLYDRDNNLLSTSDTIDLPIESMVVDATYDDTTKEIVLTLQSGSTVRFSVADLVSGLESTSNKVTSISASSTDTQYPSAKCVYNLVGEIAEALDAINR